MVSRSVRNKIKQARQPITRRVNRIRIHTLWKRGDGQRQIARTLDCSPGLVSKWVNRFIQGEKEDLSFNVIVCDKPRSGAPPKITQRVRKAILKFTEGKPNRQADIIKDHVKTKFGVNLTVGYIREWLKDEGLKAYHRPKRPRLLDLHKKQRVIFARTYKNHDWLNTLFTDEWEFPLNPKTTNTKNDIVWARSIDDVPPVEVEQYSEKVRVWGGVSAKGKTRLIVYHGDLTAEKYNTDILKKAKPDFKPIFGARNNKWTFIHDGASAHKAKRTNAWLTANVPHFVSSGPDGEWPAKSPDLNCCIEHVWGYLDGELRKNRPKSIPALERRLQKLWKGVDLNSVVKQAQNMDNRLKSIITSKGEWTGN
jgi:transposase